MKRRVNIIIAVGIILLASLSLYEYFNRHPHQAGVDHMSDSSSMSDVSETPPPGKNEASMKEEAWAKAMRGVKSQNIEKISTFVQGKECFSSDQKILSRVKEMLSRLTRKEHPKEINGYEGGWTSFHIYGRAGIVYMIDMLNMEGGAAAFVKKGEETLCCDISAADEKFLHRLYGRFYDKYAVDEDDE